MLQQMRSRGLALALAGVLGLSVSLPVWSAETESKNSVPYRLAANQTHETIAMINFDSVHLGGGETLPVSASKTIAVVDFENHTGDAGYDNLKRGASESLMTKLARRPEFNMVERNQLDKAIKELGFGQSIYADPNSAKQIGKMLNADYIVTGDIVKAGNRFEINVRMIEVQTAKVLVTDSYNFQSENDILLVIDYLALLIPRKLNLYVSDTEIDTARVRLNNPNGTPTADNSWIYWTIGGVVVGGALLTLVVLAATGKLGSTQNITQCVGAACTPTDTRREDSALNPELQLPLLHF